MIDDDAELARERANHVRVDAPRKGQGAGVVRETQGVLCVLCVVVSCFWKRQRGLYP